MLDEIRRLRQAIEAANEAAADVVAEVFTPQGLSPGFSQDMADLFDSVFGLERFRDDVEDFNIHMKRMDELLKKEEPPPPPIWKVSHLIVSCRYKKSDFFEARTFEVHILQPHRAPEPDMLVTCGIGWTLLYNYLTEQTRETTSEEQENFMEATEFYVGLVKTRDQRKAAFPKDQYAGIFDRSQGLKKYEKWRRLYFVEWNPPYTQMTVDQELIPISEQVKNFGPIVVTDELKKIFKVLEVPEEAVPVDEEC